MNSALKIKKIERKNYGFLIMVFINLRDKKNSGTKVFVLIRGD